MFRVERGPLIVQTLAICLASQVFDELHFVTDTRGAQLAEVLGWEFTHVSTSLQQQFVEDGLDHVWALGKLAALLEASDDGTPVCHLDNDVLLFNALPNYLLRASLCAQSPDPDHHYIGEDMDRGFRLAGLQRDCRKFNAGLLGGADVPLVRAYAYASLACAENFRGCDLNGTTCSMIVEQALLGVFAHRTRAKVSTLFTAPPVSHIHPHYAHLVGGLKRNPQVVARMRSVLSAQFPAAASSFASGWSKVASNSVDYDCGCGCHGSQECGS